MGAWGVGLYSSDFALDLASTVKAVSRLPFEPRELLEHICATEAEAAARPEDPDHTIFWLTVADQFAKRGIDCPDARERALAIIESGADIAAMSALGMDAKSLAKRREMLEKLGARISAPIERRRPREVLKAPQKLLFEVGDILIYPVCGGNPINPYAVGKPWQWVLEWRQDAWGAMIITRHGRAFDYLAWYAPLVMEEPIAEEPSLEDLAAPRAWVSGSPGTLSARHAKNMQMKRVGRLTIASDRLSHFAPPADGFSAAVSDISIANSLQGRKSPGSRPGARIRGLRDIVEQDDQPPRANLSGHWRGTFTYAANKRPPVEFDATLSDEEGRVTGEIVETVVGPDGVGQPRKAVIEGKRIDWLLRFTKRYPSPSTTVVEYEGEVDKPGVIAGRWKIPRNVSGEFTMKPASSS